MVYTHSNSNPRHTTLTMFAMHLNNEDQKNQEMQTPDNEIIDGAAEWGKVLQGFNQPTSPKKRSREDLEREIQELRMQLQPKKKQRRLPPMPVLKDFIADTQNFKQQLEDWNQKNESHKITKLKGKRQTKPSGPLPYAYKLSSSAPSSPSSASELSKLSALSSTAPKINAPSRTSCKNSTSQKTYNSNYATCSRRMRTCAASGSKWSNKPTSSTSITLISQILLPNTYTKYK